MEFTKKEIERIELKWECIRRSPKYRRDYNLQQKLLSEPNQDSLEWIQKRDSNQTAFLNRWFFDELPDPQFSTAQYRDSLGDQGYKKWLENFLGLVRQDPICSEAVFLESYEVRKALNPQKHGGHKICLRTGNIQQSLTTVNEEKLKKELQSCTVSFNALAKKESLISSFRELIKNIKKIDFKKYGHEDVQGYRLTDIPKYLSAYDNPRKKKFENASRIQQSDECRQIRRELQKARKLIENNEWRLI